MFHMMNALGENMGPIDFVFITAKGKDNQITRVIM